MVQKYGMYVYMWTHAMLFVCQEKEEPGLMEQVKSEICDNVTLYAQKYEEEFAPSLPTFVNDIWQLLINTGVEVKYDMVRIMQNKNFVDFLWFLLCIGNVLHVCQNRKYLICEIINDIIWCSLARIGFGYKGANWCLPNLMGDVEMAWLSSHGRVAAALPVMPLFVDSLAKSCRSADRCGGAVQPKRHSVYLGFLCFSVLDFTRWIDCRNAECSNL